MRILFDYDTPRPLRRYLTEHTIDTADEMGWARVRNGNLLDNAEGEGYEIMITADAAGIINPMSYKHGWTGYTGYTGCFDG